MQRGSIWSSGSGAHRRRKQPGRIIATVLERYFGLSQQGTDIRTEFVAGVTTFLTMVYIVFVNPIILGKAGMDPGAVFVATCVAAAVSTMVMALYANYPIALAPGMGHQCLFRLHGGADLKYTWQQALAAVFCSGVLFFLISVFRIRQYVIESIPQNLKLAVSAGVGLFLGIIALEEAKVVVAHPATLVTLGDLTNPQAVLMLLGFVLIAGAQLPTHPGRHVDRHTRRRRLSACRSGSPNSPVLFRSRRRSRRRFSSSISRGLGELTFLIVVFSILFIDVFDNAGTLIGVTHRTGLMKNGKLARMKEALISDSFAAMFGAVIGTSTTTSYIESAAGVSAGGRTGLTAAFVGVFFLLTLFFAPLAGMIPAYASAAALLYVACVMARGLAEIDWDDITEYAPAVVTAITMPLTYSIATGIGLGFITYTLAKTHFGKGARSLAGGHRAGGAVCDQVRGGRLISLVAAVPIAAGTILIAYC